MDSRIPCEGDGIRGQKPSRMRLFYYNEVDGLGEVSRR